jgi:hypothetical protein
MSTEPIVALTSASFLFALVALSVYVFSRPPRMPK